MASTIWDEFKNLFKTDQQLEEERQKKINEALSEENSVVDKLKELENNTTILCRKRKNPISIRSFPKSPDLKKSTTLRARTTI